MENKLKIITRDRHLTPEESAKYNRIRQQVAEELPELIARHHARLGSTNKSMKYFLVTAFNLFPNQRGDRKATNQFVVACEDEYRAVEEAYVQHHGLKYCVNEMQRHDYKDPEDYLAWVRNNPDWEAVQIEHEQACHLMDSWNMRGVSAVVG
jgi:hypothetical protein